MARNVQDFARSRGHDLIVHGELLEDGRAVFRANGRPIHTQQIADALLGNPAYQRGTPVQLVTSYGACGLAQELEEIIGARVNASPFIVDLHPSTGLLRQYHPLTGLPSNSDHESGALHPVTPLGVFGVVAGQRQFEQLRDKIVALGGMLHDQVRPSIARYLRSGATVFAIMEYTRDVVAGAYGVSGGSAIVTDGTYYWRSDTAEYVERYGTGLPEDFLRHWRVQRWAARSMAPEDVLAVDRYLSKHARGVTALLKEH
jgi:hypothetical protein